MAYDSSNRAGELVTKSELFDSLMEPDFIDLKKESTEVTFEEIIGYQVQTELDRRLLLGVWKNDKERIEAKSYRASRYKVNLPAASAGSQARAD